MSDHKLVWIHEGDYTQVQAVCDAEPGTDCRLGCERGCESYTVERDEAGPYHLVGRWTDEGGTREVKCRMEDQGECNVVLFLEDAPDEMRSGDQKPIVIGSIPIKPMWEGDYYSWEALDE